MADVYLDMDQRTDRERRPDTLPGREARPAIGEARPPRSSWLDRLRQRRRSVLVVTALIVASIVALVVWWVNASTFESTDDAFIDTRTVSISSQVSAAVVDVPVTDNQLVEAGAVLVRLDDRDFRAQVDQAKAQIDQAQANIDNIVAQLVAQQARIDQADKQVEQAQAALTFAQQQDERYQRLVKTGAVTVEQAQQYASDLLQARPRLPPRKPMPSRRKSSLPVLKRSETLPPRKWSRRTPHWSRPKPICRAPSSGAGRRPGRRLDRRQGDLCGGRPGADDVRPARRVGDGEFQGDATRPDAARTAGRYRDRRLSRTGRSKVTSTASRPAAARAFSLLPPENATGNYVKIVQRVPVKIVFDEPPDVLLGPGMSVVPTVKER